MRHTPTTQDDDGREAVIVSSYAHCGISWESSWDSACDDGCPICGKSIEAQDWYYETIEE